MATGNRARALYSSFVFSRSTAALVTLLSAAGVLTTEAAHAGGYYLGPIGGTAVGRAGAFTARADDMSAAYYNPAGFALQHGTALQLDNKFSYNTFEFAREPIVAADSTVTAFPPVQSSIKFQPLDPLLGVSSDFGLSDWAFAIVAYANSGVSAMKFPLDGAQRYLMTEREGIFVNYTANVAWRPHRDFAIGANVQVVAVPSLKYQLVVNGDFSSFSNSPIANPFDMVATVEGSDLFTLNANFGAWYRPAPSLELGLSTQFLPAEIKTTGPMSLNLVNDLSSSGITEDPVLLRNYEPANDVDLTLPLPMTARLGGRYINHRADGSELFDIELDVSYETWSSVERFVMDSRGLQAEVGSDVINIGTINVEKHWKDVIGFALGGDYNAVPELLNVRAGAYYETAVSDPEYSNVDFITGQQIGGTLGASLLLGGLTLSLAYEYRFQPDVTTTAADGKVYQVVPLRPEATTTVNGGTYRANSHSAALGINYRF